MNMSLKLTLFRESRNWTIEHVAQVLCITVEKYYLLECGKLRINNLLAKKLSELYVTPIELFIKDDTTHHFQAEVIYTNCSFSGGGSNGYINHQYNDRGIDEILFLKKEEIKSLKEQIEKLQQQNDYLLNCIKEKNSSTSHSIKNFETDF